jgi:hypothetical protein
MGQQHHLHAAADNDVAVALMKSDFGGLGVGLMGAHRTGKTTTARAVAQANGIGFLGSVGTTLARDMRLDLSKPLTFEQRLFYQEARLALFEKAYAELDTLFVSDRTPLDLAAYLLAEVPATMTDPGLVERVRLYISKCYDLTNTHFMHICLFRPDPGIPFVAEDNKAHESYAYQEQIHILCSGLLIDRRSKRDMSVVPIGMIDQTERVTFVSKAAFESMGLLYRKTHSLPSC